MVSIVIPAYNESAVIRRTLNCLLDRADSKNLEIIVSCNGCSDDTAQIAREFGPPVKVSETAQGSKPLALNLGDATAVTFPRIYLDADICLSFDAIQKIEQALSSDPKILAVAPRMRVDLTDRPWLIRAFYRTWLATPYHTSGMIGSGVYALSAAGRARFEKFPDIIADDAFVRAQFGPDERKTLENCEFTVIPPTSFTALLKIKTRARLGNQELKIKHPDLISSLKTKEHKSQSRSWLWKFAARPWLWPELAVYFFVKFVAAYRAKQQLKTLASYQWERDDSSRVKS